MLKIKATVIFSAGSLAVDDSCFDNSLVIWVCTLYSDSFAFKINIPIAITCINPRLNNDCVSIDGGVNSCLDIVEIGGAVIINGDGTGATGKGQYEKCK
jgi:hypothetical protein